MGNKNIDKEYHAKNSDKNQQDMIFFYFSTFTIFFAIFQTN